MELDVKLRKQNSASAKVIRLARGAKLMVRANDMRSKAKQRATF